MNSNAAIEAVKYAKYLRITLSNNLECGHHLDIITKKPATHLTSCDGTWSTAHDTAKESPTSPWWDQQSNVALQSGILASRSDTDKLERINRRAARMMTNDYEYRCSNVTAMMKHLEWPTLEHRREIQRLAMMFKAVRGLVAVPSTQLTPVDKRTRANHQFKYRNILTNSAPYKFSFFPRAVPSRHGTSYQPRWSTLQHSTRSWFAYPKLPRVHRRDIPIGVCRLHPRTRTC